MSREEFREIEATELSGVTSESPRPALVSGLVEQVGGVFGVTVAYTVGNSHVDFFAAEVTGTDVDETNPIYWRIGATSSMDDPATELKDAERYVEGSVKWDGCSHLWFGDENAYIHVCGKSDFVKLATTLAAIYERCGQLMKENGSNTLDGEF